MLWTNTKRIVRSGFVSFWRNSFVSLASIFVMTMTVIIIGSLMFLNIMTNKFISYINEKVDVNVYFVPTADNGAITSLTDEVKQLPEVAFIEFMSRETALSTFRAKHEDDQLTLQALDELADNPFGASLAIKAKDPAEYAGIAQFLSERMTDSTGTSLIESVNYAQNKSVIDQLDRLTAYVERFAYIVIALFAIASILITFNTIRLAIYTAKDEISVMRLVGASNGYIGGPFIVEGTLYGLVSGILALLLFVPLTLFFRNATTTTFGTDIFSLYVADLWLFVCVLILVGALLGAISSLLAVRKYLSV